MCIPTDMERTLNTLNTSPCSCSKYNRRAVAGQLQQNHSDLIVAEKASKARCWYRTVLTSE